MPNYKDMYLALFRAITEAISILQQAQQKAEEAYLNANVPEDKVLPFTTFTDEADCASTPSGEAPLDSDEIYR